MEKFPLIASSFAVAVALAATLGAASTFGASGSLPEIPNPIPTPIMLPPID